ncbi:hypothetical protein BJ875DRAFT_446480 [Amylocarpus encephaloides]|uniref:DNA/RNA-binding domain-containing protein n=1 Tax=Amylocarpus encephaloides TaxID=45428 RepID=A0A9P7Y858_9HELO|nr:hypothetical protein BJ875DRAFT_446480 [Amylocarpus encephaloides]
MTLLYETIPAFEVTWIECLGDIGRYGRVIENDNSQGKEEWTAVAKYWYVKASDRAPTTGYLYHHLAIIAYPNPLEELFYYWKSLGAAVPFFTARPSILIMFQRYLDADNGQCHVRLSPLDTAFLKVHKLLFTNTRMHRFDHAADVFLLLLNQIGQMIAEFMEQGYQIVMANHLAMLGFSSPDNVLMKIISQPLNDSPMEVTTDQPMAAFRKPQNLSNSSTKIILGRKLLPHRLVHREEH